MQQMIRDRVVGSEWFKTFVMLVIVFNSLLLWPWTDAEKQQELSIFNVYSAINFLFIIVYLAEFILKVCLCSVLIFSRPYLVRSRFLPRDALQCKARYCDRMSSVRLSVRLSVRPSVCNVGEL